MYIYIYIYIYIYRKPVNVVKVYYLRVVLKFLSDRKCIFFVLPGLGLGL